MYTAAIMKTELEASKGTRKLDMRIDNIQLVNVFTREIYPASIGIYNVNKRIKLIYGTEYGLSVLQTENDKFVSRIRIPRQNERMEEDEKKG